MLGKTERLALWVFFAPYNMLLFFGALSGEMSVLCALGLAGGTAALLWLMDKAVSIEERLWPGE